MNDPMSRLHELLADAQLDQLTPEDRAELESLCAHHNIDPDDDNALGELILALDESDQDQTPIPTHLARSIESRGRAIVAKDPDRAVVAASIAPEPKRPIAPWLLTAACILIALAIGIYASTQINQRDKALDARIAEIAQLEERINTNTRIIEQAKLAQTELESKLDDSFAQRVEIARQLAEATSDLESYQQRLANANADLNTTQDELDQARLAIAKYEAPQDPELLAQNRRKLLEVPDTIRVAWQPFDLPDSPAQLAGIQGDVVWNDELETGYLRFVGLPVNDPSKEQYQVWVIDERGMEQKVSGGVFNASNEGEVIVPIDPAIDVGRVAVFAITVENPGGTWVPDLSKRVVVAPRPADG